MGTVVGQKASPQFALVGARLISAKAVWVAPSWASKVALIPAWTVASRSPSAGSCVAASPPDGRIEHARLVMRSKGNGRGRERRVFMASPFGRIPPEFRLDVRDRRLGT